MILAHGPGRLPLQNPVLVASGYRDTIVPSSSAEATTRAFLAISYVSLGEVGHNSPRIEAPTAVPRLLSKLLDLTDGSRSLNRSSSPCCRT